MAVFIQIPELDGDDVYIIVEHIVTVRPLNSAQTRTSITLVNGDRIAVDATPVQVMTAITANVPMVLP